MRKIILLIGFVVTLNVYSQESTLDIIAQKTCEYMGSEEVVNLDSGKKTVKLGVFIISQYSDYKEQLSEEGIDIDFSEENAGRLFGEKVGLRMMNYCPDALIALASGDTNGTNEASNVRQSFTGEILSIIGDDFSFVQVENPNGIIQNFLWLSNFKGSETLISNKSTIGLKVKVTYKNTECYSPKLKEYINRKEIIEIEYLK